MFFIVGWGHQIKKTVGPVQEITCKRCNNTKHWILEKVSTWVTFFFIPIIRSSTRHYIFCPICNNANELTQDEFMDLIPLAELNNEAVNKSMSEEEYANRLKNISYGKTS